jgi:GT2 family glycosyltransferase
VRRPENPLVITGYQVRGLRVLCYGPDLGDRRNYRQVAIGWRWLRLKDMGVRDVVALPKVSVVMPVRNEERIIARCVGAILAQDYPSEDLEIIIADGDSDDATVSIIQSLPEAHRIHVIRNPRRSQASGLNAAIACAYGDVIVRVDAHTIIAPDYVRQCVLTLETSGAEAVGGCLEPVGVTYMGRAVATALKSAFAVPSAYRVSTRSQYTDDVSLGAWPRTVFDRVGMFDERYLANEDYEFHVRIRQSGGKVYLAPEIRSQYYGRQTLGALARQFFTYGRSKPRTLIAHPTSVRPRHLVAPGFVTALVGLPALATFAVLPPMASARVSASAIAALAVVVGLYSLVSWIFAVRAVTAKRDWRLLTVVPLVFAAIHTAWGAGFWVGVFFGDGYPRSRIALTRTAATSNPVPNGQSLARDADMRRGG